MRDIFSSPMHLQFDFLDLSSSSSLNDDKTSAGNDISLFFKGVQDEKEKNEREATLKTGEKRIMSFLSQRRINQEHKKRTGLIIPLVH